MEVTGTLKSLILVFIGKPFLMPNIVFIPQAIF